ncbi:hypothetical protein QR685DRAFT_534995 [Neurospora intermedia]|uniref:Uncharacterized protein n=1 Tax=Neurospora intermedia TaxID=5142 RepID=A0ABR3D2S7_NEUIN
MPGRPLCVWHACVTTPGKELGTMENLMGRKEIACTSHSIAVFIVKYLAFHLRSGEHVVCPVHASTTNIPTRTDHHISATWTETRGNRGGDTG